MTLCKCGCGQEVKPGNKFIRGHNSKLNHPNKGKKHPNLNINPEIPKFVNDHTGKHFCQCGCGEEIIIEKRHYSTGIPKFIHGHNKKKSDIIKVCEYCGNEFIAKGNQTQNKKKTCSKECQYKLLSLKVSGKQRVKRFTKICKWCSKNFEVIPSELHQIFCSHKCYTDWYSENLVGDKNSKWNSNLTNDERIKNKSRAHSKEYVKWRKLVFRWDNYTCQYCDKLGSGNLNVHHIMGWNKYINLRFNIDNGITLCEKHHNLFHKIYGKGNNTKEQFIEFMENK